MTGDFTGTFTNHSQSGCDGEAGVVWGARRRGMGVSGGCFGQQRRGHGAGLGADRLQQQQVTGGNYPKAKHVPAPTKMYFLRLPSRILSSTE